MPKTMPTVAELPKNSPTAGEDSTVSLVLYSQSRPEPGLRASRVAGRAQHPQVTAVGIGHAVGDAGGRVAPLDDLGLPVAVEVGQRGRGEVAVGLEPREPVQHRPVRCVEGVLVLPERACRHVGAALEVADGERRLHAAVRSGVGRRVRLLDEPLVAARWADGLVAAHCRRPRRHPRRRRRCRGCFPP